MRPTSHELHHEVPSVMRSTRSASPTRLVAGALLAATVLGGSLAACFSTTAAFGIRTAQAAPQACMDALMAGSLERHAATGLGIETSEGTTPVEWPFGYRARLDGNAVVLLDETGKVVAREHDRVNVGGGLGAGNLWFACAPVTVEPNTGG